MNRFFTTVSTALLVVSLGACVEQQQLHDQKTLQRQAASADDLLIVDCLLPGQIRKLGSKMTYLSARRPIQTTVQDCEIRGGEYVAYDRATYDSALRIWLPLAEQGDADAQNKIGEIYERGIGGEPDYVKAAYWYRKAAEQGLEKAQINLGFLLEKGLGVKKDLNAALAWYRKASKLPDAVMIDKTALDAQRAELASLRQELQKSRKKIDQARQKLLQREKQLQREHQKLERQLKQKGDAPLSAADRKRLAQSQERLQKQHLALTRQQERIRQLEAQSRRQKERLLLLETEGATLREQLALVRNQLQRSQQDLQQQQARAGESQRLLEATRAELDALIRKKQGAAYEHIRKLQEKLHQREQELQNQQRTIARLSERATMLASKLKQDKQLTASETQQLRQTLSQTRKELQSAKHAAEERSKSLATLKAELQASEAKLSASEARAAALETQLKAREKALAEQRQAVERLRIEADQWQRKLKRLEKQTQVAKTSRTGDAEVPLTPPSIQLIEPALVAVRSNKPVTIPVKRGLKKRTIIGQISAPAGLYALTVNGERIEPNTKGLFEADIPVTGPETPVSLVAIDKRGKRGTLAFNMVVQQETNRLIARQENPLKGVEIGRFYALVIGNQEYQHLPDLDTSANDAEAMAAILRDKFGYQVTLLRDATRYQILSELNRLRKELTEKDNLLIYYAGHGELDRVNLRGHWLPVDAELTNTANWISNIAITDILNAMSVRHVLLVADSCYSGTLTRSSLTQLEAGMSEEARRHWLQTLTKMRSRTALTSGGLAPVLDGGGGKHSVFAKAFLSVLEEITSPTEGQRVYREVSARVAFEANRYQVEQVPQYAPIKYSGHEAGDFIFVPKTL